MKKIVRRGVSLGFQTYEDTLEFEYDESQDGIEEWVDMLVEQFEKDVLEKGVEWYNKIKATPEYQEQQKAKANKGNFNNNTKKNDFKNKGGYDRKPSSYQNNSGGNTIKDNQGRELRLNGSERANQLVRDKMFGHAKQWDLLIKMGNVDVDSINSYQEMQSNMPKK